MYLRMSADKANPQQQKDLIDTVEALQTAANAQDVAKSLREKGFAITDPKQREQLFRDAYEKEVEAHGQSKLARRLQSGTWQGLAGGGGIGAGVGMGLGTVVGVVTGGLVSLPTTALGALIGSGVGAVHGPWIKLGGQDRKPTEVPPEEIVDAALEEKCDEYQVKVPATAQTTQSKIMKKQPRKLEVRSSQKTHEKTAETQSTFRDEIRKGKPRKLEVRSSKSKQGLVDA